MTQKIVYAPGEKTHRDENFPVASYLIAPQHRKAVMAFYLFARSSDDVADHPALSENEKITRLNQFEETLLGQNDSIADAIPLREVIAQRRLSPRHGQDLLVAFRQDASKARYRNWDELVHYCMYSAAPVGRFVLEAHGESPSLWPASDAVCCALQIINHLQDCKIDYQKLNRIYIPQDALAAFKLDETSLEKAQASPALKACIADLATKAKAILAPQPLSSQIRDKRLRLEIMVIEKITQVLIKVLQGRDPLSERVHLTKLEYMNVIMESVARFLIGKQSYSSQ